MPSRLILHGVEGVGKTSFAAHAPNPLFIQARGETGLETLVDAGQLPETPFFPECQTWSDLEGMLRTVIDEGHDYKTLVLDTINGLERLCHEHVCHRDFNGDWGEHGFMGYMRGYEVSLADWRQFLTLLDELREKRRMAIIGLCHTKVVTFKNPEGADYDRYAPDMHPKTWSLTHKWADIVLFGNFEVVVDEKNPKRKGNASGGQLRTMHSVRHAAFDAKNRHGLPEEIDMGDSGKDAWNNFLSAMKTKGAKS